ncbi:MULTISPECIES: hypothetical protein [unclassified Mesorhizobium]|uniref:hypothetical protein n=1 Tax=unclassified Mesorhizobium TaxID=325217 RepID=UPI001CCCC7B8|nr:MULTISPECIES: hypothetical protein [unclassified Mesorhizobium]MBZ9814941.1 hypothetical protein [Mesorhizobium sp. CA7]
MKNPAARRVLSASWSELRLHRQRCSCSRLRRSNPTHIAVSEIECRRGGFDFPSWLILDQYNRVRTDEAYDLVTVKPIGSFSPAFVRKIAGLIKEAADQRGLRGIVRK